MLCDKPLLSFAVPTWNRADLLDGLLSELLHQLHDEPRVELLISDNASTDGTAALVATYQQRGLNIRYIRNEVNTGADGNILQCYEQASGSYVWIFSDDDLIGPGAIERVLTVLSAKAYDLVCVRHYSFSGEYREHRQFAHLADHEFTSARDLARKVHVFFTFISGIIVNKERVESVPHSPFTGLIGTNLVQLGPYFTALSHHRKSLLIRDPIIAARGNDSVNYALYHVFGCMLSRITREWIASRSVQRAIVGGTIRRFLPSWIIKSRRSRASTISENPHQVLYPVFGSDYRYWAFDYPIYALPLPLAHLWLLGIRLINSLGSAVENALEGL
jgi:glycosyltransferase involved in cell wall biosynthesis